MLPLTPPPLTLTVEHHARGHEAEVKVARTESQGRESKNPEYLDRTTAHLQMSVAPVHRLPVELLAEIFLYSIVWILGPRFANQFITQQVRSLSHVCAHWRQVAITTPRLWTELLPIKLDKVPTEAFVTGLQEWLARSAPCPIPVRLNCAIGINADAVVHVLLTVAHRWREAYFALPSLSLFSNIPSDGLKQLRKLTLRSSDPDYAALAAFTHSPNLTEVDLDTPHAARLMLPWTQLASLRVQVESSQDCLDTLLQCANLVTAEFHMSTWPGNSEVSELKPITLGRLEVLTVCATSDTGSTAPFFACLALPALKTLSLNLERGWAATAEFAQFQLRAPNIEALIITDSNLDSYDLMAILHRAPAISELTLKFCSYALDVPIVAALSSVPAQLAPRLRTLSMVRSCDLLDEDTVDALIAARWWADEQLSAFPSPPEVSRWASISIDRDEVSPELEAELDEYRRQGLTLNVN
ncbi:hypothetical protein C8R46DRAFT_1207311 [Mycena filopes]|nr:hypothetical protein C8R46DRAFT_1207311 [Mycena filopes]